MEAVKGFRTGTFTKSDARRQISGMVSTVDVDRIGDVMIPNGVQCSINPGVTMHHDDALVVGTHNRHQVKGNGVWVEANIGKGWPEADACWAMLKAKALRAWSIEYEMIDYGPPTVAERKQYGEDARRVGRKWALVGYSLVRNPCQPNALIDEIADTKAVVRDWATRELRAGRLAKDTAMRLGVESGRTPTLILCKSGVRIRVA